MIRVLRVTFRLHSSYIYPYVLDRRDTSRRTELRAIGDFIPGQHGGACSIRASPASPCFSINKFSQIFLLSVPGALLPLVTRSILYTSHRGFKRTETFQTGGSLISVVTSRKEVLVIAILLRHVERYFMLRLARHILYRKSPPAPGRLRNAMRSDMFSPIILQRNGDIHEINLAGRNKKR